MPSSGIACAHVVDDPLRRQRKAAFRRRGLRDARGCVAQRQSAPRMRQLAFEPVGEQREARADIADELRMREDTPPRRSPADSRHAAPFGPFGAHDEGRLLHRVVADRDDEIGPVDRLMDIVALGERRGAHVEVRPASDRALAHLRIEERESAAGARTPTAASARRGRLAAAPNMTSGRSAARINCGRAVERGGRRDRQLDRVRRDRRHVRRRLGGDVLRQFEMNRARPLLLRDAERFAHQRREWSPG